MREILTGLFNTTGFPPRWHCGIWSEELGWLHICSDIAIWAAYTAIPCVLAYFILRRQDIPFPRILWLFVAFIFACGATHLIEAVIFWQPVYRLAGVVKFLTAVVSLGTVAALVHITPNALRLPGLARLNDDLLREVGERKRSEERLSEEEERLRFALLAGRMGTWEWKIETNEVVWSTGLEAIHGLAPGTFPGTFEAFLSDVHPQDRERVETQIRQTFEQGRDHHVEYRIVPPDGGMRWVEGRGKLFRDAEGRAVRMSGVCMDVTPRKRAEEDRERLLESERYARGESERANRMKDEFLSLVSHELRTPLNAILGYAQLLGRTSASPEHIAEAAAVIERNGRIQAQIIEDLLDMSRIITGKMRLDVEAIDLCDVISSSVDTIRPAAEGREIQLHVILDPKAGHVLGDASRLQQVFWNLLSNAIRFTPKGGKVQVSLRRVNSHVEARVSDTGQGIRADLLPSVFDRFRQGDASASRQHGGLGLGLSLVKHLVELHGGTVTVSSEGEGQGATFTINLPVQIAPRLEAEDENRVHPSAELAPSLGFTPPPVAGLRVLVVDDEADSRMLVRRLLEPHGIEVKVSASAEEALGALKEFRPDVLLSDIGMPGIDGYRFIQMARALGAKEGGGVPAAALTAFARSQDRTKALLAGYQAHITKPVHVSELLAVIAALAGRTGGSQ